MSRPKDPLRYPPFLYEAIQRIDKFPSRKIDFPCQTLAEAQNFRLMFNCFKKAALDHGWDKPGPGHLFCPSLANIIVRIDRETFIATLLCSDHDPAIKRWSAVVGIEPIPDEEDLAYPHRKNDSQNQL